MPGCALRLQLVELAIQGGATIENALKVAVDWERWIHEAADPIRLDVPSPVVGEVPTPKTEIDWSYKGTVMKSIVVPNFAVVVDGDFDDDSFMQFRGIT